MQLIYLCRYLKKWQDLEKKKDVIMYAYCTQSNRLKRSYLVFTKEF